MEKRGYISLSSGSIVIIILSIILIALSLSFFMGLFKKTNKNLDELFAKEIEPSPPTVDEPITLSRSHIRTTSGSTEAIKVAVLNPTGEDWVYRDQIYGGFSGCGASDSICYVSDDCDGSADYDCQGIASRECKTDGVCFLSLIGDSCPMGDLGELDDCGPNDGIDLLVKCGGGLKISKISQPRIIKAGETQNFMLVLDIIGEAKNNYLCEINVFGNALDGTPIEGFKENLEIEVN